MTCASRVNRIDLRDASGDGHDVPVVRGPDREVRRASSRTSSTSRRRRSRGHVKPSPVAAAIEAAIKEAGYEIGRTPWLERDQGLATAGWASCSLPSSPSSPSSPGWATRVGRRRPEQGGLVVALLSGSPRRLDLHGAGRRARARALRRVPVARTTSIGGCADAAGAGLHGGPDRRLRRARRGPRCGRRQRHMPPKVTAVLMIAVAVVMTLLGTRLTGLSPRIAGWSPTLPMGVGGRLGPGGRARRTLLGHPRRPCSAPPRSSCRAGSPRRSRSSRSRRARRCSLARSSGPSRSGRRPGCSRSRGSRRRAEHGAADAAPARRRRRPRLRTRERQRRDPAVGHHGPARSRRHGVGRAASRGRSLPTAPRRLTTYQDAQRLQPEQRRRSTPDPKTTGRSSPRTPLGLRVGPGGARSSACGAPAHGPEPRRAAAAEGRDVLRYSCSMGMFERDQITIVDPPAAGRQGAGRLMSPPSTQLDGPATILPRSTWRPDDQRIPTHRDRVVPRRGDDLRVVRRTGSRASCARSTASRRRTSTSRPSRRRSASTRPASASRTSSRPSTPRATSPASSRSAIGRPRGRRRRGGRRQGGARRGRRPPRRGPAPPARRVDRPDDPAAARPRADDRRPVAARRSSRTRSFQLALATPVQFWAGWPFYVGACKALRHSATDMNTLIAVGTSAAYFYSVATILFPAFFMAAGIGMDGEACRCTSTRRPRSSR